MAYIITKATPAGQPLYWCGDTLGFSVWASMARRWSTKRSAQVHLDWGLIADSRSYWGDAQVAENLLLHERQAIITKGIDFAHYHIVEHGQTIFSHIIGHQEKASDLDLWLTKFYDYIIAHGLVRNTAALLHKDNMRPGETIQYAPAES